MDAIDKLSPVSRQLVAATAREYLRLAGLAREADRTGSPNLRSLVDAAKSHADLLARDGIDVADEDGETNYGLLINLLADPASERLTVAFSSTATSRNEPYLIEDGWPDFYETYAVEVPPNVAACWRKVAEEWAAVQADMKAAFEAARRVNGDHEAVQSLFSRFEHEDRWAADKAAYEADEARLDETVGPREWAKTTYQVKINRFQSATRWRLHKRGCASLNKVFENGPMEPVHVVRHHRNEAFVRTAEARELLRDVDTVACQRCARELETVPANS